MKTLIVGRKVLGPAFRIAIFILLFAAGSVRGFETWEHRKLGDDGYRIAAVIALAEHPDAPPEFRRNVLEYLTGVLGIPVKEGRHGAQLSPSALEPSQVTYGNVAALPDYEKEPESLWDNAAAEHEMGRLDMIVLGRIVRNTTTRGPINISGFYVAHSNSNHFGARGLNEYDLLIGAPWRSPLPSSGWRCFSTLMPTTFSKTIVRQDTS